MNFTYDSVNFTYGICEFQLGFYVWIREFHLDSWWGLGLSAAMWVFEFHLVYDRVWVGCGWGLGGVWVEWGLGGVCGRGAALGLASLIPCCGARAGGIYVWHL